MHPDILGWMAAALMVATFSCREARHLRPLAVATNLAFVGYGAAAGLMPVLALHLVLLPINLWRWAQAIALSRRDVRQAAEQFGRLLCVVALSALPLVAGCGGGGGDEGSGATPPLPPSSGTTPAPAVPPAPTIGAAGGTVSTGDGAEVAVPAGALSSDVAIEVQAGPAGAPALPPGLMALGKVYAFTPHGTTFALPAKVTVPFDAAQVPAGAMPVLYKAEASGAAAGQWFEVAGAMQQGGAMQAEVGSFSYFAVAPPLEFRGIHRDWEFLSIHGIGPRQELGFGHDDTTSMALVGSYTIGRKHLTVNGSQVALARYFSSSTGSTYGIGVESPAASHPSEALGADGVYRQVQWFRKRDGAATLSFVITHAEVQALDFDPRPMQCNSEGGGCRMLRGHVDIRVSAWNTTLDKKIYARHSSVLLFGAYDEWFGGAAQHLGERPLWPDTAFVATPSTNGTEMTVRLAQPLRIHIPLDGVEDGQELMLDVSIGAQVTDRRQRESHVRAFFRDPQDPSKSGLDFEFTGLDHAGRREPPPGDYGPLPGPACAAADPAAGTLQFEGAQVQLDESAGRTAYVFVTRTGGSRGHVSARVAHGAVGSAVPGVHFRPLSDHVAFADGEAGRRAVAVALIDDSEPNPPRTLMLNLDDVRGCAAIGAQASTLVTVADDDFMNVPAAYRVGGTVSGLAGSGLVLEDRAQFIDLPIGADGSFQFSRDYSAGAAYDVRVKTPPSAPTQTCTVSRGSGTVAAADVADIAVDCTTPPPSTGLDLAFGAGTGKVTAGPAGVAKAIALLPDGRILAAIGNSLARYLADGTLDTTFGSNGSVGNVVGPTNFGAEILDLAVQADGRIVATGTARGTSLSSLAYDFAAARLNADGSRDTGFNGGNALQVDWAAAPDRAARVLLQPDGKIVLAGQATTVYAPATGSQDSAMALVRLNADGSLDTTFGTGGRAVTSFGLLEAGQAVALQPDGRIVIAGRVADNLADSQFGVARFNIDGTPDTSFGGTGQVRYNELADATALALQPDGRLVLALAHQEAGNTGFGVVRLNADGSVDTTFGASGLARLDIGPGVDAPLGLALQAAGRIVVVGSALNTATSFDFVVARFLPTGAVDTGFGTGGFYSLDLFRGRDGAHEVLVQPDGKLLVSGSAGNGLSTQPLLMRFHP